MITIKTQEEIALLREGGRRHAWILQQLKDAVAPGVSTKELNDLAVKLIREGGDTPSFLGYTPAGAFRPYPAALCVSINNEVVHGVPNEQPKILKEGDIVSLDLGVTHTGMITDAAITVPVGTITPIASDLIQVTTAALEAGIAAASAGRYVGDIGYAVSRVVEGSPFSIVDVLAGHGVGYKVHEDPFVPNVGRKGEGPRLKSGMVLALEPIVNEGGPDVIFDEEDGYTVRTADGKLSAHFEHTILITDTGAEVLTR